jgi:AraC-like DNA-binding protein
MKDKRPFRTHISTRDFPERKRLDMWREIYGRAIGSVDIEPIGDTPFHAEVTFNLLPDVSIAAGSRTPAHYHASKELLARGGKNIVVISMLRSGAASATQFGRELIDGIGSASVLASNVPSSSTMLTEGSFITLALAQPAIATLAPRYADAFGRTIRRDNAALGLLARYVDLVRDDVETPDPALMRRMSDHILDLAALALGASGDYAEAAWQRSATAARFAAIKTDILHALNRSDLSTETIALRHGISPRYVRKLFEQNGSSFSDFVLAERLAQAQRMLTDKRHAHLNIAQIAHESGFGDVSYFHRVFRRHFGATPTDFRETARPLSQARE